MYRAKECISVVLSENKTAVEDLHWRCLKGEILSRAALPVTPTPPASRSLIFTRRSHTFTFLHFHSSTLAHLHFCIASDNKTSSISPAQLPTNIQVLQEDLTLSLFRLSLFTPSSLYTCIVTLPLPLLLPPKAPHCPLLPDRQHISFLFFLSFSSYFLPIILIWMLKKS